ncbi:hypothetical protein [Haloprofundus sp. MHR1]|uniref:hypothetical protein n=1 Tax=Haloprofundus sp. MHR1 TaxID=2572921 RepID=UPI0010BF453E|nr:hypothetical protein [Haloprofundus sp. MHR1]QCJ45852.1 hypothetical protein FCF25_01385 [Haloprofundus sp. MHR1]
MNTFLRYTLCALAVTALLLGGASTSALADTSTESTATDAHEIGVTDLTVDITDVHLTGSGFPELEIDEASYTIDDATLSTDGATVSIDGRDHQIGAIEFTVDNVGFHLENITIGPETAS